MGIKKVGTGTKRTKKSKNIVQTERQFRSGTGNYKSTKNKSAKGKSLTRGISKVGAKTKKKKPYERITKTPSDMPIVKPKGAPRSPGANKNNIEGYRTTEKSSDTRGREYKKVFNPESKSFKKHRNKILKKPGRRMA